RPAANLSDTAPASSERPNDKAKNDSDIERLEASLLWLKRESAELRRAHAEEAIARAHQGTCTAVPRSLEPENLGPALMRAQQGVASISTVEKQVRPLEHTASDPGTSSGEIPTTAATASGGVPSAPAPAAAPQVGASLPASPNEGPAASPGAPVRHLDPAEV